MQRTKNDLPLGMKILPALTVIPASISAILMGVYTLKPWDTDGIVTVWGVVSELFVVGSTLTSLPIGLACIALAWTESGRAASPGQRIWLFAGAAFPLLAAAFMFWMVLDELRHFRA